MKPNLIASLGLDIRLESLHNVLKIKTKMHEKLVKAYQEKNALLNSEKKT